MNSAVLAAQSTPALRRSFGTLSKAAARLVVNGAFVGNEVKTGEGGIYSVVDAASGETLVDVSALSRDQLEDAVSRSASAFKTWRKESLGNRVGILRKWNALVEDNSEDLAKLITLENGKPLAEAKAEVAYAASYIRWFAEEALRHDGSIIPSSTPDKRILVLRQPVGLVGAITPWNFPLAMITRKVAPAIVCGCPTVLKPSEITPLSALALAVLGKEAGLPADVFNVVVGDAKTTGEILSQSKDVRKITFTGSTAVGKLLAGQAATTVKRVSMELGGNAPFIIFDDADLDHAVECLMKAKFRNAGQTCVSANRVYIQNSIAETFYARVEARMRALKIGHGLDEGVEIGPLINDRGVEKVEKYVADALAKGAVLKLGGRRVQSALYSSFGGAKQELLSSKFFEPTLLSNCPSSSLPMCDEVFGPVVSTDTFETEDEIFEKANDTQAGLASYVFTRDLNRAFRAAEELEYGMVGVNEGIISNAAAPFGGVKESGYGREGSRFGLDDYTFMKYVCIGGM